MCNVFAAKLDYLLGKSTVARQAHVTRKQSPHISFKMATGTTTTNDSQGEFILNYLEDVVSVLEHVVLCMQQKKYLHRDVFGVQLALEEAINNALRHGNGSDPAKSVRVAYHVDTDQVWLEVEDEGDGFEPATVRDPTLAENIDQPGGRGLLFIRTFMNLVEYNSDGNQVRMLKRRSPR